MFTELSSTGNPKIKELLLLAKKSKERRESGLFVVEGVREIRAAVMGGYRVHSIFFAPSIAGEERIEEIPARHYYLLTKELYSKIAYRAGTEGVVAIIEQKRAALSDIKLSPAALIVVLEGVEKPGNLGAVIRSADGVNADAVIVCDPLTDVYNPNVIRSSLGGVFTRIVCIADSEDTYKWLKEKHIQIYTAELQASEWYYNCDFTGASAIVLGSEADGLKPFWRERADRRLKIPMYGEADSLNLSVSAAVICYEALRQRAGRENLRAGENLSKE